MNRKRPRDGKQSKNRGKVSQMLCNIRKLVPKVLITRLLLKLKGDRSARRIIEIFTIRYLGMIKVNYEIYYQITFKNKKAISRTAPKTSKRIEETSAEDK